MTSFLDPLRRSGAARSYVLTHARTGAIVADDVMTAFDSATRRRGLLGRDSLPATSALIIAPSNGIHTFFMRFAIDVAFVTKSGRVTKIVRALPARRIALSLRAFAVIELAPGALDRAHVAAGDTLALALRDRLPVSPGTSSTQD